MSNPITLVTRVAAQQEAAWLSALAEAMPDETIVRFRDMLPDERARSRVAIVANPDPADLAALPNLAWVQSLWAGVEQIVAGRAADELPVVRLVDPELSRTMAEAVLAWTYYLQRDMPRYRRQQGERQWLQHSYRRPAEMRVGIVGLGTLGGEAARRLCDAGFEVAGWSRTPKSVPGVRAYCGTEGLSEMLSASDIVVCLVPLTASTRGLLDRARFAAMKPGAALINFARGPVVVADDLIDALDRGHLSHAVLDVFDEEPLPPASRFWDHPRVTVLPHISAPTHFHTAAQVVAENVRAWRASGRTPRSVDPALGY
ncbi:glyoxylate/hydroxypyruvate reductase A [Paraburkholderia sp. J12]|uniref:2-hydroxyacid dehydrogenase n=1 Tax=Paraburkholderia sp. J12 TaxID=2805432 RepID=UPI002ABDFDF3|nr:glyoxylate/hydroxypyruvate reductase A [Paraburkholderia sp. J12]